MMNVSAMQNMMPQLSVKQVHSLYRCTTRVRNFARICVDSPKLFQFVHRSNKCLKKSNAACFYTPILFKLLIIIHMFKNQKEKNFITINLTPHLSELVKY